jgi:hypothetical protein
MKGELITVRLLCKIYRQGYYTDWNDDMALLFAKSAGDGCPFSFVNEVVSELLKRGFFDEALFKRFSILTSHGIQKRYFKAIERRIIIEAREDYLLIYPQEYPNISLVKPNVNILEGNVNIINGNVNISEQRIVKESKVKKSKEDSCGSVEPQTSKPFPEQIPSKPKKPPLREREPANDMEHVEKAYLQNWDLLYSRGQVKTPNPEVNWNQTRNLLKNLFARLKPEQIIQAINNGLKDDWIMSKGYSLGMMLSANMINGLINGGLAESQVSKHQLEKQSLG